MHCSSRRRSRQQSSPSRVQWPHRRRESRPQRRVNSRCRDGHTNCSILPLRGLDCLRYLLHRTSVEMLNSTCLWIRGKGKEGENNADKERAEVPQKVLIVVQWGSITLGVPFELIVCPHALLLHIMKTHYLLFKHTVVKENKVNEGKICICSYHQGTKWGMLGCWRSLALHFNRSWFVLFPVLISLWGSGRFKNRLSSVMLVKTA